MAPWWIPTTHRLASTATVLLSPASVAPVVSLFFCTSDKHFALEAGIRIEAAQELLLNILGRSFGFLWVITLHFLLANIWQLDAHLLMRAAGESSRIVGEQLSWISSEGLMPSKLLIFKFAASKVAHPFRRCSRWGLGSLVPSCSWVKLTKMFTALYRKVKDLLFPKLQTRNVSGLHLNKVQLSFPTNGMISFFNRANKSVTIYSAWLVGVRTPNLERSKQPFIHGMSLFLELSAALQCSGLKSV